MRLHGKILDVFLLESIEIQPWDSKVRLLMIYYWNLWKSSHEMARLDYYGFLLESIEIWPWGSKDRFLMVSYWNILKSIGIYWNILKIGICRNQLKYICYLFKSIEIYWNLLASIGNHWNQLKYIEIYWNLL